MPDQFTEQTNVSWFSRIKNAFFGFFIGIILIIIACVLLIHNEGDAVHTQRALSQGSKSVIAVQSNQLEARNQNRLIHISGMLQTQDHLSDPLTSITTQAVSLQRHVVMYQWVEDKTTSSNNKLGGGQTKTTTYNYQKKWESQPQDSSKFEHSTDHQNPPMQIYSQNFHLANATLGAFRLNQDALTKLKGAISLPVDPNDLHTIQTMLNAPKPVSIENGGIYIGENPYSPSIGDYAITYSAVPLNVVSVIGQQFNYMIRPYYIKGDNPILLIQFGNVPADVMFHQAEEQNKQKTWFMRGLGLVLLFAGFSLLFAPLSALAMVVPILGYIVEWGTSFVSLVLTVTLGGFIIAFAWFGYRPLISLSLFIAIAAIVFAIIYFKKRSKPVKN